MSALPSTSQPFRKRPGRGRTSERVPSFRGTRARSALPSTSRTSPTPRPTPLPYPPLPLLPPSHPSGRTSPPSPSGHSPRASIHPAAPRRRLCAPNARQAGRSRPHRRASSTAPAAYHRQHGSPDRRRERHNTRPHRPPWGWGVADERTNGRCRCGGALRGHLPGRRGPTHPASGGPCGQSHGPRMAC